MLDYKNEIRIRVNARRGTVTQPDLNPTPGYETPLDKEIIICAGKCMKGPKLMTFFWAYHCANTWEEIQIKFHEHLERELQVSTLQKYARDAVNRILDRIARD